MSVPIPQEPDKRGSARATAPHEAASDSNAPEVRAVIVRIVIVHVIVIIVGLAAILQQLGDERAAHAPAPQYSAGDQQAEEFPFAVGALLADILVVLVHVIVELIVALFVPCPNELRDQRAADTTATKNAASDDEAQELALVSSGLLVIDVLIVLIHVIVRRGALSQ